MSTALSTSIGVVQFACTKVAGPLPVAQAVVGEDATEWVRADSLQQRDVVLVPHPDREVAATAKEVRETRFALVPGFGRQSSILFSDATIWHVDSGAVRVRRVVDPTLWGAA